MFRKDNKFGEFNKGCKRPDLSERNRRGMSLETRKKLSISKKGKGFVFRPSNPCPRCKSIHVVSAGSGWRCFDCKHTWIKIRKAHKSQKVYHSDVSCPKCCSHQIKSMGKRWHCGNCGKEWMKQYKEKEDYNYKRKLSIPIEEIEKLYYEEKMSQSQIAKKFGVSQGTILNFMRKHDLQTRPKHMVLRNHFNSENLKKGYRKVSEKMKGNTNWKFSHKYPNSEEQKLIRFFNKWNLSFKYVGDGSFKIDGKCPDFINEEKKLIIEFFGELWHEETDEPERIKFFEQTGWKTLIIWGKEIRGKSRRNSDKPFQWERPLYDRIVRWMAGL